MGAGDIIDCPHSHRSGAAYFAERSRWATLLAGPSARFGGHQCNPQCNPGQRRGPLTQRDYEPNRQGRRCHGDRDLICLAWYRYIELNPVRAGMVDHPGEYRWSSFSANAQGAVDETLCPHDEYRRLGATGDDRQTAYRALFHHLLDPGVIVDIRDAVTHELVVGTSRFKDEVEATTHRRTRMGQPGRPSKKSNDGKYK